jgi:surface protein
MAIKLGNKNIDKAYLGGVEIKKLCLGENIVFDNTFIPFIIEIDTANTGTSNNNQFQFTGAEGDYDVVAKQNNIVVATFDNLSGAETITLPSSGVYVLEVKSKEVNGFNRIAFDNGGDKNKIIDIKQWGEVAWSSFERAFFGCKNMLVTANDVPNLSNVNSMFAMFYSALSANPNTTNWDVSNVTDMSYMFYKALSANPDTSNWNVSNVTNMNRMFYSASIANPNTTNWDVSSVTDMRYMFYKASLANPDVSNWDVSSVTNMRYMFYKASSANPDTSNWDVSSVTYMERMFESATVANPNTSNWDVSNVINMSVMFYRATSANPDTSNWDVSSVTTMFAMFLEASSANPDVSNWDVSNVINMDRMFEDSNLSVENLTACYENWSQLSLQQNVPFSAGTTKYNASGQAGRDILVNTYNWTITDGGQVITMLNQFPNASLGLSLDKLDKNYTGSAIKVRRSSDNNELDIGFVNGILDTASLLDFVGSGNGFISIWYDQSGEGNNLLQTLASRQPQIVSNGSLILENGKPCIDFLGLRFMALDSFQAGEFPYDYITYAVVSQKQQGRNYIYDSSNRHALTTDLFGFGSISRLLKTVDSSNGVSQDNVLQNGQILISALQSEQSTLHINNVDKSDDVREGNIDRGSFTDLFLGSRISETKIWNGTMQEIIIFKSGQGQQRIQAQNNINTRYNIY